MVVLTQKKTVTDTSTSSTYTVKTVIDTTGSTYTVKTNR